ncbi:MAG: altronate dehydratase [Lachnospiraceae bacterium]|nr:altronate dehydratase [Lachnospiraceae bacterium]
MDYIQIHPRDNVAVALRDLPVGTTVACESGTVCLKENVVRGHKVAICDIPAGEDIIKYGCVIGKATQEIAAGSHVHSHNVQTELSEETAYAYAPVHFALPETKHRSFEGYVRADGRVGIRNELWIIPVVGCVNGIAENLVKGNQDLVGGSVEGLYTFAHPFGCSQLGEDHEQTKKILTDLAHHPNAGGVLVLGLGCENLTLQQFQDALGSWDESRVKFLICQDVEDEIAEGSRLLAEIAAEMRKDVRRKVSAANLVVGLKCGGSDGLSGITANPTVGRFSDRLIALGGSTILTEVPEMFGAESLLFNRCEDAAVYQDAVQMVEDFKDYFVKHGQVVYENPSPGNKAGGITTLEDKSCGCVQKGGSAPVVDVLRYGERVKKRGLSLLSGPGNDLVSSTALSAAGCHLVLFTTGRGTPFGAPAPTVKIASNTALSVKKSSWIDFNAGTVAEGESLDDAGERLLDFVMEIASGKQTKSEEAGIRAISIFKDGVVL